MDKIKVLFITPHLGGGVGKAIIGLAVASKKNGVESKALLLEEPEKHTIVEESKKKGIFITVDPSIEEARRMIEETDVVIINWWNHPLMVGFLMKLDQECRLVIWNHINGCVYPYLNEDFLLQFDEILFTSRYSDENSLWNKEARKKILGKRKVIFGFGDFEPKGISPKKNVSDNACIKVGYVGTLSFSKMNRDIIRYCDAVAEKVDNIEFHFAGDPSEEFRSDLEASKYRSKYFIDGYIFDMDSWFNSTDIFLYLLDPDHYGTTENAILEAMAYGLPVILLDNPNERVISGNGAGAILIDNERTLTEQMKRLCEDNAYRIEQGDLSRKYVCKTFSADKNAREFREIIEEVNRAEKRSHDFLGIIGATPWDWFLCSSGDDRRIFEQFIQDNDENALRIFLQKKAIYTGRSKGSVYQFSKYFPREERFRRIVDVVERG